MTLIALPGERAVKVRATDRLLIVVPVLLFAFFVALSAWTLSLLGNMMVDVDAIAKKPAPRDTPALVATIAPEPGPMTAVAGDLPRR